MMSFVLDLHGCLDDDDALLLDLHDYLDDADVLCTTSTRLFG
jgi:hypothetical protein